MMLDQPCKFHTPSPSKPAIHTTRQCTWFQKGDRVDSPNKQLPPPPPPPLTGGNAQAVGTENRYETGSQGIIINKEEKLCTRCIIQEVTTLMSDTKLEISTENITRVMSSSSQSRMTKRVSSDG